MRKVREAIYERDLKAPNNDNTQMSKEQKELFSFARDRTICRELAGQGDKIDGDPQQKQEQELAQEVQKNLQREQEIQQLEQQKEQQRELGRGLEM